MPTKEHIVKAMFFPVVRYGCESWTTKKVNNQRIDVFELWCWRRLLRVHWTAERANQSILKEISPEYSLGGPMPKLKLQYFGHLMQRADSLKDSDSGKEWMQGEKGMTEDEIVGWYHQLNVHEFEELQEIIKDRMCWSPWGCKELDTIEQLNNNNSYSDAKTRKRHCKKWKFQVNILDKYRYKNPQQNISKLNSTIH